MDGLPQHPREQGSSRRRAVVTGIGVVSPVGIGAEGFWAGSLAGPSRVGLLDRFDARSYRCRIAGQVDDFRASDFLARNTIKQTDRSVHMALACCQMATDDAGLVLSEEDPESVGMYFANIFGGMEFAEPELHAQTFHGPGRVSAYQSIAWFFAAAQGQWSIANGIKGFGKSIVGDRAGGHQALTLAALAIRQGHADVMYAGGFEAPLVPYVFRIHETSGLLAPGADEPARAYRPFDQGRSGLVLAEGAAVLVLEEAERAARRGARVYAELAGGAMSFDGGSQAGSDHLARCLEESLLSSGTEAAEVGWVLPEGLAVPERDRREAEAVWRVFGDRPRILVPKARTGHALAASGALDAAWVCLMLSRGRELPAVNLDSPEPTPALRWGPRPEAGTPVAAVCCGGGYGGLNAAFVLRRPSREVVN